MKIYRCCETGDEMFTDTYPLELVGGLFRIKGRYVCRSEKFDDSKIGANASAEEQQDEGADESSYSGIDVVLDNRLQKTGFSSKKDFMSYFKDLLKKIEAYKKEKNPDFDVTAWRTEIQNTFKTVLASFDQYEFYTGESCNPDGTIAMVKWETPAGETDDIPYVYFFADSVREEKV
ncbi:unnamed protein product [Candidula unifasciata]|uniref:TCTP domain-containing protein n=1 Tax=Candidula unifasciata TaxID=100452 RepID=A0A8S4A1G3_9EUPU|nr:unnamed protein product [Candidula unifasciata]